MSYQRTKPDPRRSSIGGLWEDINNVVVGAQNVKDAIAPAIDIVSDPYFPTIVKMVGELHALEQGPIGSPSVSGVGLKNFVTPLRWYIEFRKNPIIVGTVAVGVVFGLPFIAGYLFGKR